jgi:RNA polymerase sigma-70 factor (ECF subfamily)
MKDKLLICNHREFLTHYLIKKFPRARKEDIEDAVQNAIIKAVRFSDKWHGNCSLRTWISVIASNMYTDTFRKTYVKNEYVLNSSGESFIFDNISVDDFSETFCESDYLSKLVKELMAGFEDNVHVQAFKLNVLNGIDYKEIAMMQNVPVGTIKSRVFRGKKLLRDKYQEICNQEACLLV